MTVALVLGANGQDGSFLCERLVSDRTLVVGVGRQPASRFVRVDGRFVYEMADLSDGAALDRLLDQHGPTEVYHVAAVHGQAGFSYEPCFGDACDVNLKALHRVLEYARLRGPECRIFYASSAKVFGPALVGRVTLDTPRAGRCLYAFTKKMATDLAAYYQEHHGVRTTVGILFNHESTRRAAQFFIPTVCRILVRALEDRAYQDRVATLSFCCDWSSVRDFMDLAVTAVERGATGEVLFASGVTRDAKPFVDELFRRYGLDADNHISTSPGKPYERYDVDISDTVRRVGYQPQHTIFDVCDQIIAEGRKAAPR